MLIAEKRVHFVGLGGVGVSALAKVLLEAGHQVSGSDLESNVYTRELARLGAEVFVGHDGSNVGDTDLVVLSSAVPASNPERQEAERRGIRMIKRAELLGDLTRQRRSITVAGTHGKTTTSSMIAWVLKFAGAEPTYLVGGTVANLGTNAQYGSGPLLVAEADEFDGSFLKFSPWVAIVTNVEADHLDYYGSLDAVENAFARFSGLVPPEGYLVLGADDAGAAKLGGLTRGKVRTYGVGPGNDWRAANICSNAVEGNDFQCLRGGEILGEVTLRVPGIHNVQNALATIAALDACGVDFATVKAGLAEYVGAGRRLQFLGEAGGVRVYDDYAHHPTEIKATLQAAREQHKGRLCVVFQPHTYHRTKELWDQFLDAFGDADWALICDVYMPAGREVDKLGVDSKMLTAAIRHPNAEYVGSLARAEDVLGDRLKSGDRLITMGAGDITKLGPKVLARLALRNE